MGARTTCSKKRVYVTAISFGPILNDARRGSRACAWSRMGMLCCAMLCYAMHVVSRGLELARGAARVVVVHGCSDARMLGCSDARMARMARMLGWLGWLGCSDARMLGRL